MTIVLAFILLTIIFTAMSIGILLGRNPITGSCGGIGAALGEKDYNCEICGGNPEYCEQQEQIKALPLAYDATEISPSTKK